MAKKRIIKKQMAKARRMKEQEKATLTLESVMKFLGDMMLANDEVIMFIEKDLNFTTRTIDVRLDSKSQRVTFPIKNMEEEK